MTSKRKYTLTKEKVKDTKEDIENRQAYIGGSDIGTIMGVNQWKSPYTLWAEKTGLITPEDISDVEAVWWGTNLEDLVAKRFTMKTGIAVRKSNFAYGCKEYPYLRGHVDRLGAKEKIGLECKTTSSWNKCRYDEGVIPDQHFWQCMFYIFLTGIDTWYLATKRDSQFYVTKVTRDDEAIERMLDACEDFWNHVQTGEPPEVDGSESTQETLDAIYPNSVEGDTVNLDKYEDTLLALLEIQTQEKSLKEFKTKYQNEIKAVLGEHSRGETGQFIVTWRTNKNGSRRFDLKERAL